MQQENQEKQKERLALESSEALAHSKESQGYPEPGFRSLVDSGVMVAYGIQLPGANPFDFTLGATSTIPTLPQIPREMLLQQSLTTRSANQANSDVSAYSPSQLMTQASESGVPAWNWGYVAPPEASTTEVVVCEVDRVYFSQEQMTEYVNQQLERWNVTSPGLQPLRDPAYPPAVEWQAMERWVTVATRLGAYLTERLRPEQASWLQVLQIRHGCLPMILNMAIFEIPLDAYQPAERVALLQTALEEAGYEFSNVASRWNVMTATRGLASELVSAEIQPIFLLLQDRMGVWRDAALHLPCSFRPIERPFVHVDSLDDVEMIEIDSEGDILMLEGVREHLTADVILRLKTVRQRESTSSTSSTERLPLKRLRQIGESASTPSSLSFRMASSESESMDMESKGDSPSQRNSGRSSDQSMSSASSAEGVVPPQGIMVMSAQAVPVAPVQSAGVMATIQIKGATNPPSGQFQSSESRIPTVPSRLASSLRQSIDIHPGPSGLSELQTAEDPVIQQTEFLRAQADAAKRALEQERQQRLEEAKRFKEERLSD